MTEKQNNPGMKTFLIVWLGQTVSGLGSSLTAFALGVWIFQRNESVTQFAFLLLSATLPAIFVSPVAGIIADRWNRRWVMICADTGAAFTSLALVLLLTFHDLAVWHVYLIASINSAFRSLQWPAYAAATPQIVGKKDLGRANGMLETGSAISELLSPLVAGLLLSLIDLRGIVAVDFATFFVALLTLSMVRIPDVSPKGPETNGTEEKPSQWREASAGLRYILLRPGLLALLGFFFLSNLTMGSLEVLVTPMVLGFATVAQLGVIATVSGFGMLVGGLAMTAWGGAERLVRAILIYTLVQGLMLLGLGMAGIFENKVLTAIAAFSFLLFVPLRMSSNQTLWQRKVEHHVQGRVFGFRRTVSLAAMPLAFLAAGPLVDSVFEPLLRSQQGLAQGLRSILHAQPGDGSAVLILSLGAFTALCALAGFCYPRLYRLEVELPDATPDEPSK